MPVLLFVTGWMAGTLPPDTAALCTVTVDLRAIDRASYDALESGGVYAHLLARLMSEDLAVVDGAQPAAITLRLSRRPSGALLLAVVSPGGASERELPFPQTPDPQAPLGVVHVAIELVRQARERMGPCRGVAIQEPASDASEDHGLGVAADTAVAVLWSGRHVGATVTLSGVARRGPVTLLMGALLHRPLGLPSELELLEWGAFAGAGAAWAARPWLEVEASMSAGLLSHRYRWDDAGYPAEGGQRLEPMARASCRIAAGPGGRWRVGLELGVWATWHVLTHRTADAVLWRAPRLRPGIGLGVHMPL